LPTWAPKPAASARPSILVRYDLLRRARAGRYAGEGDPKSTVHASSVSSSFAGAKYCTRHR
jgi:hypothetical protein